MTARRQITAVYVPRHTGRTSSPFRLLSVYKDNAAPPTWGKFHYMAVHGRLDRSETKRSPTHLRPTEAINPNDSECRFQPSARAKGRSTKPSIWTPTGRLRIEAIYTLSRRATVFLSYSEEDYAAAADVATALAQKDFKVEGLDHTSKRGTTLARWRNAPSLKLFGMGLCWYS